MKQRWGFTKGGASRRSFLKDGIVAAGAATIGTKILRSELSAFERDPEDRGPAITGGDVAILQFLAAAELIESDLWQQYNELGGVDAGNSGYVAALSVLDGDMSQYISDNADDEISHHGKPPGGSRGRRRNVLGTNGGQQVMALLFCGLPGANGSLGNATVHGSNPAGVPGVPGNFGGNMDYAGMNAGAKLMLPVNEPGALLFIGDGHARMGEGEVVGSGLETSMDVEFTVDVVKKKPTAGRASRTTRIQVLSPPTFRS